MKTDARALATLIGTLAILMWAALGALTVATGTVPPFELAALTFAIGGGLGLIAALVRGQSGAFLQGWKAWLVGVGGLFGYHALYFAALRLAPASEAGLISYLWPLLIVLFSALLPGEKLLPRHILGALLGLAGVIVLVIGGRSQGFGIRADYLPGYALALACAFLWSGYSVLSRFLKEVPTDAVAGFCLMTALLAGLCHVLFETTIVPENTMQWLAIIALGTGPVGLAFYVWDYGVKHGDIRMLGIMSYATPVLSTLILVVTGTASPTWSLGLACLMIVAAAIVASWRGTENKNQDLASQVE